MRSLNYLIYGIVCAFSTTVSAATLETLTITVHEKGDGKPLADVTVLLKDSSNFQRSDSSGVVVFKDVDDHAVFKFIARGYETVFKPAIGKPTLNVFLAPLELEGQGVSITADRIPQKAGKITMSKEELVHTPGAQGDPIAALTSLPGVISANESGGDVYMRGSDTYDNATVVNRIPIGYLYHLGGARSTINPELVDDINLFLSNPPVQYYDVLGGVTDVRLRAPKKDRTHKYFDISMIESSFLIEGPVGNADANGKQDSYFFGGRRSYYDLIISPSTINDMIKDDSKDPDKQNQLIEVPYFYDANALYRHELARGYLDFAFFTAFDRIDFDLREGQSVDPNKIGELSAAVNYQSYSATWHENISPNISLDFPLVYYRDKTRVSLGNIGGTSYYAYSSDNQYSLLPQYVIKTSESSQWTVGSELHYFETPVDIYFPAPDLGNVQTPLTDRTPSKISDTIYATGSAIYVDYNHKWNNRFKTLFGIRGTRAKVSSGFSNNKWMPRLGIEYQLTKQDLLTANYGKHAQYPIDFQMIDDIGNPNLGLNEAVHRSLGLEHQINQDWNLKAEIYDKPMSNLVIPLQNTEPRQYANAGSGYAYGIDIFLKRKRSHGRMGWIGYSYGKTKRKNEFGETIDFDGEQPHTIKAVWGQGFADGPFDWMKRNKLWNWSVKLEAHSGRLITPIVATEARDPNDPSQGIRPIYGATNSLRLPTYLRADLRLERDILSNTSKSKFYVEIMNVTNRKNIVDYDYGADLEKVDNPNLVTGTPIFPFIGFETKF